MRLNSSSDVKAGEDWLYYIQSDCVCLTVSFESILKLIIISMRWSTGSIAYVIGGLDHKNEAITSCVRNIFMI